MIIYNTKLYHHPISSWKRRLSCFTNCSRRRCCLNDNCCFKPKANGAAVQLLFCKCWWKWVEIVQPGGKVSHKLNDPVEAASNWAFGQLKDLILLVCLDGNLSRLISVVQTWFHSEAGSWINWAAVKAKFWWFTGGSLWAVSWDR